MYLLILAGSAHTDTKKRAGYANCLVINARSIKRLHKTSSGKQFCNLHKFHELVYSENADLVWVPESWLNKDIKDKEILPTGYTIYSRDRETRAGGVFLAVKSDSFITSCEVEILRSDLEVISVELITASKHKLLVCCAYSPRELDRK